MARRASVTNNSDLSGQDHRRAENKWKTPMENSENGSAELKKIIDAITGKKVVAGGTAHALEYAKNAWEKCGGDELIPEMDENAESRFWWRLLAYRYANLLMRVAGSIDDFRFAEKLFDKATGMKDPKGKQSYRELTLLSKIYRIAVIRRILSSDAIDSEERAKYSTLQNNVWSSLFNSRLSLDTEIHTNSPTLQTCFHHLLEVTSYGNGLAYEDGLEGQNVIIGIPDSKFDGYQVVDNRQAFSTTLYRYEVAVDMALSCKEAMVFELLNYPKGNNVENAGKWLNRREGQPKGHTLALLAYALLFPKSDRFPGDDNTRQVRKNFLKMIDSVSSTDHKICWPDTCAPSLEDHPDRFIGILDYQTISWLKERRSKSISRLSWSFGKTRDIELNG